MTASRFAICLLALSACVEPADPGSPVETEPAFLLQWENTMRAADFTAGDIFGFAVAMSGSTAVIGAPFDDVGENLRQGAVHVYTRNASGDWVHRQKLTAAAGSTDDRMGTAVAISGNTVIAGAPMSDAGGSNRGAAHVFVLSGTCWVEQATLVASNGAFGDDFGRAVAIEGQFAVVGAPRVGSDVGAAYVFSRTGSTWTERVILSSNVPATNERFGTAVSVFGVPDGLHRQVVLVGAPGASSNRGAVLRFESLTGNIWPFFARHVAADGVGNEEYGAAIDLDDDPDTCSVSAAPGAACTTAGGRPLRRAAIGAPREDEPAGEFSPAVTNGGAVYVIAENVGGTWSQQDKLVHAGRANGDELGTAVALDGDFLAAGAPLDDLAGGGSGQGSVRTFTFFAGDWDQEPLVLGMLVAGQDDNFGSSVALDGSFMLAGARFDDDPAGAGTFSDDGSATAFNRFGGAWSRQDLYRANDDVIGEGFGTAVALDGDTALVGVPGADRCLIGDEGAVYVFQNTSAGWALQAKLTSPDPAVGDGFGASVGLWNDVAMIGAPGDDSGGHLSRGAVYQFVRSGITWSFEQKLTAFEGQGGDEFGRALAMGEWETMPFVAVGAWLDDGPAGFDTGSVQVWLRIPGTPDFTPIQNITAPDAAQGDSFGASLALGGGRLIVGAPFEDHDGAFDVGKAYVFEGPINFVDPEPLVAQSETGGQFGATVAINSDTAFVGAPLRDGGATDRGAFHIFELAAPSVWQHIGVFNPGVAGDRVGSALVATEDALVVGAPRAARPAVDEGAAYLYLRGPSGWALDQELIPPQQSSNARLGSSAALDETRVLLGAPHADGDYLDQGAVLSVTY
jgi:hypothetical protein